jgi:hypothetical protein
MTTWKAKSRSSGSSKGAGEGGQLVQGTIGTNRGARGDPESQFIHWGVAKVGHGISVSR